MSNSIHSTAQIDPGAIIGQNVTIGPNCLVEDNVIIGDGVVLDAFAQVKKYTRLADNVHIHSYAIVGGEPQHLAYKGEETWVEVGENTVIREFATIHRGTIQGNGKTVIGANCFLMAYVHVAHDCLLSNNVIMSNASSLAGHVEIGHHVMVSGMSGVHQFVRIGDYAFLGAMGGFGQDVPPYTLATGVRASLHGLNLIGLRRNGFSRDAISALKKAYQQLFRSETVREQALVQVEQEFGSVPEVMHFIEFIKASKRGVTPHKDNGEEA
ncbi:MAG: acyl-ACP--UDP-N-acetylglucosamine O-acyltransferase [Desulfovibrio sp.]|uniref:acyl-ACP--UDP-N-acetylglucosamine O-acyltransferase n=1 Tax=Desulfovibrio sp. 7SRBS1 TaxID=3378064 RepID=UPI003B3EE09D